MPPTWKQKGFYEEKKHRRNEFPPKQHGFNRFQQSPSGGLKIPGGGGGGDGARNRFLEDPSHVSGSGSYLRTTKPRRDPKPRFVENVSNRHFDHMLASPSQAHSVNTQKRLQCIEQLHVDNDHNKKHERESSMGMKPFNKWKGFGRFYSESMMSESEGTRKRPRLNWGEGLAKPQKRKTESDGEIAASASAAAATPTSVGSSSLSGLRTLTGGDASGSESNGRNTRAPRDPRPQFWENVKKKHFDNVLTSPSPTHSINSWRMFHYGKQHNDNDQNKNNEGETSVQLNLSKRWSRSQRFYHGDTGKEKDKNALGEGSDEIKETRKRRLNWGEGLAKFEKKKREVEGVSATSAVASTPTSVACSSLSVGVGDALHAKTATGEDNKFGVLSASVTKLLESADLSSSLGRSNAMTKVLVWKTIISKVLEETQTKISSLENELKTMQSESQSGHNPEALAIVPFDEGNIEKMPLSPHMHDSIEDTLWKTIISCNREIVKRSNAVFDEFCPTKCHKVMCSSSPSHANAAIKEKLAEKEWFGRFKERVLISKYKALDHLWKKDMVLRSLRKYTTTSHSNFDSSLRSISNDCHRNRSSTRHRFPFPGGKKLSLVPTSEMITFTSQLLSESQNEVQKRILKMPSMILDEKDKMISMFKSRNGLVEDPVAVEKERAMINPWTSDERKIYSEKFQEHGKDFRKIASFLDHKTTADCVEFYYKSHKVDCLKKDKKRKSSKSEKLSATKTGLRRSGRKRSLKVNVDSQKKLSEAPLKKRVIPCERRTRSGRHLLWKIDEDKKVSTCRSNSNSLAIVVHERERVSTDPVVDLCDSLPNDPVEASSDEVNVVKANSDTNENGDRNLNQDEFQHVKDKDMSEPTKTTSMVSNESIIVQDIMEKGDETVKFVPASKVVESLVNEVNGTRVEANVVEAKLDTNKNDDQRNLNHDESQPDEDGNVSESMEIMKFVPASKIAESPMIEVNGFKEEVNAGGAKLDTSKNEDPRNLNHDESHPVEDRNVSESTEIISIVSNECIVIQDIMEDGDQDTKFVPASEVVEPSGNEVNIEEPKSYTNKTEDERNLNHEESQLAEDGIVSESKAASMVSSDCIIMQDIVEVGGEVTEFVPTFEMVESPVHEVNGSRDAVNVVEGDVSEPMESVSMVSNKCIIMQDTVDEGDEATKFVTTFLIVESPVDEVNIVEAKSDTHEKEDQRNLNHDEFQLEEDGNVSKSTEIISFDSSDCKLMQSAMEEGDNVTKFVPASVIVESPVNEVNDPTDEVNVAEAKSDTNEKADQRNPNHDEFQLEEDGNVSESTEITSFVSSDCTVMQNAMEEGDNATKFVPASVIVESPVNDVNVVKAKSDTNEKEDQRNQSHDEFQLEEDGNVSESTEITSFVSSDCTVMQNAMEEGDNATKFVPASVIIESPVNEVNVVKAESDTNEKEDQRNLNHDEFELEEDGNVSESTEITSFVSSDCTVMQNVMDEGDNVTKFVPASVIVESPVNEVKDPRDEVNFVEAKLDTDKKEDQRNLNHDEVQFQEDRNVSETTEKISYVSSDCTVMQNVMKEGDNVTNFVPASVIVESPVNEVKDPRDEVNFVGAKLDTDKKEDQRNLNHEVQFQEDRNVSETTEIRNIVPNDCTTMQNIKEERDKVTKFVPTSVIVESPVNDVNVAEAKPDTNEKEDQRNLNHHEFQLEEDGNVSESTEITTFVSSDCTVMQNAMEEEDNVTKFVSTSVIVESPVNDVNVVKAKSDTNKKEDQRNLSYDEFQVEEDGNVSESIEITSFVSSDCTVMQNAMEEGDNVTRFVPASVILESPVNEVNLVEAKSDTNEKEDQSNLNHDEFQLEEDGNVSESTKITSFVSSDCTVMQNVMEEGDNVTKFVPASLIVESPMNDVNVVEAKSDTNEKEDQRNLNHDEFQLEEDGNVSESTEITSSVSSDCTVMQNVMEEGDNVTKFVPASVTLESPVNEVNVVEARSDTNIKEDQRNLNHDEFQLEEDGNVSESTVPSFVSSDCTVMQNVMEEGDNVTNFVPASVIVESPVNGVKDSRDEVNFVEAKSDTNRKEDQGNPNRDEFQLEEDKNVSESTEIINFVPNDCTIMQNIVEEGDKVTKFVPASVTIESPVNEVNVVEAKSDTNEKEDQRNLNHDEFQLEEDRNVSESTEIINFVPSDCTVMQNIMEEGDKVTEFVPASVIIESPVNQVNHPRYEVNVTEAKADTNEKEDQRNLNHDEFQLEEDRNVRESTEIRNFVSSDFTVMQNIMEGDKVTEFVSASVIIESPVNQVNVLEAKSGTSEKEDQRNLKHDEFQPMEDSNVSESTEKISVVSGDYILQQNIMEEGNKVIEFVPASDMVESPLNEVTADGDEANVVDAKSSNKNEDQSNLSHDESQPMEGENVSETTETTNTISNECIVMQDILELEDEMTELVPASETVEPCQTHSVAAEDGLVSEKLAELPTCPDGKCEHDDSNIATHGYGVALYNSDKSCSVSDEVRGVVAEVESASRITVSSQTHSAAEEDILVSENTLLQNTVDTSAQQEITTLQPQEGNDELHNPGILLKDQVDRQVKTHIRCSSSSEATELPQNIEETEEHDKAHCPSSSASEIAPTEASVLKLFGKIITVPSSVNENAERGEDVVGCRERPKRKVSAPKYLKDYFRFK